jgi:four helix bundle protein
LTNLQAKTDDISHGSEAYGLSSQLKRASVSIAANIAEGRSRNSDKDFARFVEIALGSAFEVETLILIIQKRYPKTHESCATALPLIEEIQKMAHVLYDTLTRGTNG